eukprot:3564-Chlamydomonas_euryale.AAC.4
MATPVVNVLPSFPCRRSSVRAPSLTRPTGRPTLVPLCGTTTTRSQVRTMPPQSARSTGVAVGSQHARHAGGAHAAVKGRLLGIAPDRVARGGRGGGEPRGCNGQGAAAHAS